MELFIMKNIKSNLLNTSGVYLQQSNKALAIIMVGLPARGKTYIARKIARYLAWLGHKSRIFNVGNYRRDVLGAAQPHEFFDPENIEFTKRRNEVALLALQDMLLWLDHHSHSDENRPSPAVGEKILSQQNRVGGGSASFSSVHSMNQGGFGGPFTVAIYDATNSTAERRNLILEQCSLHKIPALFIESVCDDVEVIMANIREVKLSCPDYVGMDPEEAVKDFENRILHYQKTYDSVSKSEMDGNISFIKLVNVGQEVIVHKVSGYIQSRIIYFLMNLNITPRSIYFARHGESEFNLSGRIGGDSDLSHRGRQFAERLPLIVTPLLGNDLLTIWTSTLKRTIQTAHYLEPWPIFQWKQLDELDSGHCEGLTYEEIQDLYPKEFSDRDQDKFNFRYHGGESYRDLVQRLEPVIMELERHCEPHHSIFIVGHQAVLRAIYAYFMNLSHEELPYINIPLHTIVKLTPKAYGCQEERIHVDIPAVNTHRAKPSF